VNFTIEVNAALEHLQPLAAESAFLWAENSYKCTRFCYRLIGARVLEIDAEIGSKVGLGSRLHILLSNSMAE